jgi:hypothetical protein
VIHVCSVLKHSDSKLPSVRLSKHCGPTTVKAIMYTFSTVLIINYIPVSEISRHVQLTSKSHRPRHMLLVLKHDTISSARHVQVTVAELYFPT